MTVKQAFFFPNLSQNGEVVPLQGKGMGWVCQPFEEKFLSPLPSTKRKRHIIKNHPENPKKKLTSIHPWSPHPAPVVQLLPTFQWLLRWHQALESGSLDPRWRPFDPLASWHLGIFGVGNKISKQKETVGVHAGVFLFKWQCLVTVGLIFFHEAKVRWELKNGRTSSVFHDSPTPWQPQGVASNVLLDHLDSWPTPSCSSQKSRSTPGRARFLGSGGADVVLLPRIFGGIAGESLLGGWKTSHFLKKMGATTICQQTPRSYHFWAHFWGIENSKPQNGHFLVEIGDFKTSISFTFWRSDRIYLPRDMASSWLVG